MVSTMKPSTAQQQQQQQGVDAATLHGETAAQRQATTELAFFASVGDLHRCKRIAQRWALNIADPRTADYDKRTPLHLAAAEGCHSVAVWLLSQAANVNAIDRFNRTPLEEAVRGDHGELAQLLMQHGAKVVGKDGDLIELADSPLAGNVRMFTGYDPEWEIDQASLNIQEKIGEGEFGVVHKGIWRGTAVAVKILRDFGELAMGDFRTELNTLQKVHHPHTVQFLGAITKQQPFMIITEYMTGGSLLDLFKSKVVLSPWRSVQVALDCARGMAYLHNRTPNAVVHRDLKPANIMLGGPKVYTPFHKTVLLEEMGCLKIADFGLSKTLKLARHKRPGTSSADTSRTPKQAATAADGGIKVANAGPVAALQAAEGALDNDYSVTSVHNPGYKLTGETGSYRYMAPEVFRHEQYTNKVDVYSFALIAYQLFEGVQPFQGMEALQAVRAAALEHKRPEWGAWRKQPKPEARQDTPPRIRQLIERCWAADPEERPEFEEVVEALDLIARELKPVVTEASPAGGCSLQ